MKKLSSGSAWPTIHFSEKGAVSFDRRTYTLLPDGFSLYTLEGRIKVPAALGERQREHLQKGSLQAAHLVFKRKKWFLHISIRQNEVSRISGHSVLGVDVGEINVAATSTGKIFKADRLRHDREVFMARRRRLQRNGSQSAKRVLRKVAGCERRRVLHENHTVSRQVVAEALRVNASLIAMEDLTHILQRVRRGKRMRARLHRWAWRQLQNFIAYKADEAGVNVVYVNPAFTSKTCASCLNMGRRVGSKFCCSCGNLCHADVNGASNVSRLAGPIGSVTPSVTAVQVA